jgi:nigerose phosphorylase
MIYLSWSVIENTFSRENIPLNGSKFLIGNGYMGYRGSMDDYGKEELVACTLAGVYDKVGNGWREPANAPNGLFTKLYCNGQFLSTLSTEVLSHEQKLDIKNAIHSRVTNLPVVLDALYSYSR